MSMKFKNLAIDVPLDGDLYRQNTIIGKVDSFDMDFIKVSNKVVVL